MPVVINEIEVVEQPSTQAPPAQGSAPPPSPRIRQDAVVRLLRDIAGREERRVAD